MGEQGSDRVLVTGGAGYIGSHTVLALIEKGWQVVVADNLSTGSRRLVAPEVPLHVGNVGDRAFMLPLLKSFQPDAIVHLAASISVPESVTNPEACYRNNADVSRALIAMCADCGVEKFIFSSTSAVYGIAEKVPLSEDAHLNPINPYGHSKLMTEELLQAVSATTPLRYVNLRYFNAAGADAAGRTGHITPNSTNLIKTVAEFAVGIRHELIVHGDDYATPDGTCIRDYIHVSDLAEAQVAALDYLMGGGASVTLNCGYGKGFSVLDVIRAANAIEVRELPYRTGPRRPGDPPILIADVRRIMALLPWVPRHDNLELMVGSAIAWERRLNK